MSSLGQNLKCLQSDKNRVKLFIGLQILHDLILVFTLIEEIYRQCLICVSASAAGLQIHIVGSFLKLIATCEILKFSDIVRSIFKFT